MFHMHLFKVGLIDVLLFSAEMEKSDKNTVYLHAEVIFPDAQTRKCAISTAIHNKSK